jgi:hypothetical protein
MGLLTLSNPYTIKYTKNGEKIKKYENFSNELLIPTEKSARISTKKIILFNILLRFFIIV